MNAELLGPTLLTHWGQCVALMVSPDRAMFRFQIIFLTWRDMWWTRGRDTGTLSSPLQWHYNDITWPQVRHWKHLEPAITTRGLTITFPPLTVTRAKIKGGKKCAFDKKNFPNCITWPLMDMSHLPVLSSSLESSDHSDIGQRGQSDSDLLGSKYFISNQVESGAAIQCHSSETYFSHFQWHHHPNPRIHSQFCPWPR